MKKILLGVTVVLTLLFAGCTPVAEKGEYKEGTYFGYAKDTGTKPYTGIAVVTVNENGKISSVFVDATYTKDGVATTKKTLGNDYAMKVASPIGKEWFEQAAALEAKVVKEQGLSWLTWKDEAKTTTDSVSGVTMKVNILTEAISKALEQAK